MRFFRAMIAFLIFASVLFVLYRWVENSAAILQKETKLTMASSFSVPKTQTANQTEFNFSKASNQPTVIHFWATWCEPCIEELPELLKMVPKLKSLGFQVLTIAEDSHWNDLEAFFKKHPNLKSLNTETQLILDSDRKISTLYHSEQFPETYVIDKNFKILSIFIGVQKWESPQMEAFFKKISAP